MTSSQPRRSTPGDDQSAYADRIAMCQAPDGPHEHVPLAPGEDPGACFMDCGCTPRVYVALDAVVEAVRAMRVSDEELHQSWADSHLREPDSLTLVRVSLRALVERQEAHLALLREVRDDAAALEAERDRYREALHQAALATDGNYIGTAGQALAEAHKIVRDALEGK